jgi:hypothetical protein
MPQCIIHITILQALMLRQCSSASSHLCMQVIAVATLGSREDALKADTMRSVTASSNFGTAEGSVATNTALSSSSSGIGLNTAEATHPFHTLRQTLAPDMLLSTLQLFCIRHQT